MVGGFISDLYFNGKTAAECLAGKHEHLLRVLCMFSMKT